MPDSYAYTACATNTTNCTITAQAWTHWTHEWQTAATTNIWVQWADVGTSGTAATVGWDHCYSGGVSDNQAHKEYEAKREVARTRAEELLQRHLTEQQRAQLARDRFFVVQGSDGKQYRVKHGRAGNVEMLGEQGQAVERLCCHPAINCPDEDTMLAQKLALETDGETFRKIANVTRLVA